MELSKPDALFDREWEWADLQKFCSAAPGLRLALVRGRRRHGKSFLLRHLCHTTDGVYTLAQAESRTAAFRRFTLSVGKATGRNLGVFDDWTTCLEEVFALIVARSRPNAVPLLVLDEFPYLLSHSPELPSAIQALYDQYGPASGGPPLRLILCGSAIATMSTLLGGQEALRGRVTRDINVSPFDYRDMASYWGTSPEVSFFLYAVLGGVPGYRDLIEEPPPKRIAGFTRWLGETICNPSHALFEEPDYILTEEPTPTPRSIYHTLWEAISNGATTPTQIGGVAGLDAANVTYYLNLMRSAGFIQHDHDLLLQRRPVITLADPIVRFHQLVIRPNLEDFQLRLAGEVLPKMTATISSLILGPQFEDLARKWVKRYASELGVEKSGSVGTTVVACREHRGHQVDVIALDQSSKPRDKGGRIALIGEAKATNRPRSREDIERLSHIRDLLNREGWDAASARLALFSRTGFRTDLKMGADALLIDLEMMYGRPPVGG